MGAAGVESQKKAKAALFYTCYGNYNMPEIAKSAVKVLERNGVEVIFPEQVCCGMPYVDIGDIEGMRQKAEQNVRSLERAIDQGYGIVALMPSCSLMLKKEYPAILKGEAVVKVAANTYDICEYLMRLHGEGRLDLNFRRPLGSILYQVPCHLRDQNIGYKSRDLMKLIPGTTVETIERCAGHDGTWGIKTEFFDASMKIADRIFQKAAELSPDWIVTDCPLSGNQITQGTGRPAYHPVQILAAAYGEEELAGPTGSTHSSRKE
jgi:Fe-S oxidoreductase